MNNGCDQEGANEAVTGVMDRQSVPCARQFRLNLKVFKKKCASEVPNNSTNASFYLI